MSIYNIFGIEKVDLFRIRYAMSENVKLAEAEEHLKHISSRRTERCYLLKVFIN